MCGGGTQTTVSKTEIPPEVLARYNAVNARAEEAAKQPFQPYTGEFVAPLTPTQQAGIQATSDYSQTAQPYFGVGTGLTLAGSRSIGPLTQGQIGYYQNPYTQYVAGATEAALRQQQGQQLAQQQAEAIRAGAFGGDRAGIQRAVLQGQQGLATAQALAPIYSQGYQQAVQTAQGQQGVIAQDLARQLQAGQQVAGLGTGAQAAALQGAQAQIGAGTLQQQTQQAQDTALYQQFLQQRGYPFQVAQFLANIAEGTGALSGSTQTTQAPAPFFSDKRLKHDAEKVGEMHDGTPIYRFKYNGSDQTQIGLMAQDVEKRHPEAVGQSQGYKTVDYKKATDEAAHKSYGGGLVPNWMGGAVHEPGHYALGGLADSDLAAILAQQKQNFGPFAQGGIYGQSQHAAPFSQAGGVIPTQQIHVASLPKPQNIAPQRQQSTASELYSNLKSLDSIASDVTGKGLFQRGRDATGMGEQSQKKTEVVQNPDDPNRSASARGGLIPRGHYSTRGAVIPGSGEEQDDPGSETGAEGDVLGKVVKEGAADVPRSLPQPGQPMQAKQQGPNPLGLAASGISAVKGLGSIGSGLSNLVSGLGAGAEAAGAAAGAAGAAGGIGSALGSVGTGIMQVLPFLGMLSDERVKHNKRVVGKLYDGQPVYSFDYGDGRTQLGLMAQNVEHKHPEAVGEAKGGLKVVDYHRATEHAAHKGHFYEGGLVPPEMREHHDGSEGNVVGDQNIIDTPEKAAAAAHPADAIFEKRVIPQESGGKHFDKYGNPLTSSAGAVGIAQVMPSTGPEAARLAGVDWDERRFREDPNYNKQLGQAYFRAQYNRYNDPTMAMAAYNAGPGRVDSAIARARETGSDWRSFLPAETQKYIGMSGPTRAGGVMGALRGAGETVSDAAEGFGGFLKRNQNIILPVLQGLGAMASSPSRYLGSAVLQGLGAGAKSYADLQKQTADIEQTQATTQGILTSNLQKSLQNVPGLGAVAWVYDPVAKRIIPMNAAEARARAQRGENIQFVNAENVQKGMAVPPFERSGERKPIEDVGATGQGAKEGTVVGKKSEAPSIIPSSINYSGDTKSSAQGDVAGKSGNYEGDIQHANSYVNTLQSFAQNARDNLQYTNTLGDQLVTANQQGGLNAPGYGFSTRADIVNFLNTVSRATGAGINFGEADVGKGLIDKINTLQGAARANYGSQHSYSALDTFKTASPNLEQAPAAAAEILAQLKVDQQMALDREKHALQYRNDATGGGMREHAIRFERDNPNSDYVRQREQLRQMILSSLDPANKGKPSAFQLLSSGKIPIDQAQKELKQLGYDPMLVKYFYSQAH